MTWSGRHQWVATGFLLCLVGCDAAPQQPPVVVYVAVDRQIAEPILRDFEQQQGVRVHALYDAEAAKTTGLVTRLVAESSRPRCDVFWNNEIVQTLALAQRDLLEPYQSPQAAGIPAEWRDPQGLWTGVALRARVIVFNTRHVRPDDVPRRLEDLTNPRWRWRVAVANPQFGTTRTHVAALYAQHGAERTEAWLAGLLANEVRIVDGNALVKNLVARADLNASPVLVGLTDTDDVLSGQQQGEPIDFVFPDQDDAGTLVIPSSVCLIQGAPHPTAARKLIDFLVAKETTSRLASAGSGYLSVRESGDSDPLRPTRTLPVTYDQMLEQLDASTQWTAAHFHE